MAKLTRALPAILVAAALTALAAPRAAAGPITTIPGAEPAAPAPAEAPSAPAPAPVSAPDAPRFELLDRGDTVEIIAHNVKAARTAILPVRSRLEVPIVGTPQAKRIAPVDRTVKLIELAEESTPVLSVKLAFERADVKALSRFAQAIQVGDDLHLLVPRKLPDGDVAPRLPDPTLPPALAARIGAQPAAIAEPRLETRTAAPPPATPAAAPVAAAPTAAPAAPATPAALLGPKPDPHPAAPTPAPVLGPKPDPAAPAATAKINEAGAAAAATSHPRSAADALAAGSPPAGPAAAAPTEPKPLRPALASDRDDVWSKISMLLALGLAAAGAGVWLMRRRRGRPGTTSSIEIIAQRSLGGKARIVWLSAGQHEMIVSVTSQQVRMLSQWRKPDAPALPYATSFADELRNNTQTLPRTITSPIPTMAPDKPVSPAVSGLLRLRRTSQMAAVAVEPPDDDPPADDVWAREILAATGSRPGVRR